MNDKLTTAAEQKKDRRGMLALIGAGGAAALAALLDRRNGAQAGHGAGVDPDALHLGQDNTAPVGSVTRITTHVADRAVQFANLSGADASVSAAIDGFSANGVGVSGFSQNGIGTRGISDTFFGVQGLSTSPWAPGVLGESKAFIGPDAPGGSGPGVQGSSGSGPGVQGFSDSGNGVQGFSPSGAGVGGGSQSGVGVEGHTETGRTAGHFLNQSGPYGVQGTTFAQWEDLGIMPVAVQGVSSLPGEGGHRQGGGVAVQGLSGTGTGVEGFSDSGTGVGGGSNSGVGVSGGSGGRTGVLGVEFGTGIAGVFGFRQSADGFGAGVAGGAPGDTPAVLARSGAPPPPPDPAPPKGGPPDGPDRLVPDGGLALRVEGKAQFSTAGAGTIPRGRNSVAVVNPAVTPNSHISVTLASNPGARQLHWVERNPGEFRVHLTNGTPRPATDFTYLIVEPAA